MNLTANRKELLDALSPLTGVAERKNTIPILSNVMLTASNGQLVMCATDLEIAMTARCPAEVTHGGGVCVPAKKLFEIVRAQSAEALTLTVNDEDKLTVKAGRSKTALVGMATSNFPEIAATPEFPYQIAGDTLARAINSVAFAVTTEESRYALSGARLEYGPGQLRLVATDGRRLACADSADLQITQEAESGAVLIPRKALSVVASLCKGSEEAVELAFGADTVFVRHAGRTLSTRTLRGQFPNYVLVLPKGDKRKQLTVDRLALSRAVKRVLLTADEEAHSVRLMLAPGQIELSAATADVGAAEDVIPVEYDGEEMTFGLNGKYVQEGLEVLEGEGLTFDYATPSEQILLTNNTQGLRYVVMPTRL